MAKKGKKGIEAENRLQLYAYFVSYLFKCDFAIVKFM